MCRCQLNFALFAVTSALGISWQHFNHSNLLVRSVYSFYVYFHIQLILHNWAFFYHMKMALAKLKIVTFKTPIIASVVTTA